MSKTSVKTTVEWNTINWKQLERRVYKIQKRIYQALARGDVKYYTNIATIKKTANDGSLTGIHDENHTTKDPYYVKASSKVLDTSRSGD
jgi:hypothetical protein